MSAFHAAIHPRIAGPCTRLLDPTEFNVQRSSVFPTSSRLHVRSRPNTSEICNLGQRLLEFICATGCHDVMFKSSSRATDVHSNVHRDLSNHHTLASSANTSQRASDS